MNEPSDPFESGETLRGFGAEQLVFGRYVLRQRIGLGAGNEVWLARDGKLEREVVLAFLPESVVLDRVASADFKREIRWALELTHPNIVRIYDFVAEAGRAAISMEYLEGDSLASLRLTRPGQVMGVEELRPLVRQLCEVLVYVHTKGQVLHCPLVSSRLLVTPAGELKVSGTRLAEQLGYCPASRAGATSCSTDVQRYLSPQQRAGTPPAATDDIYSLGAVLHELLTGELPSASGGVPLNRLDGGWRGARREAIPPEWADTVAACLAEEPALRPQSGAEVAQRLGLRLGLGSRNAVRADGGPSVAAGARVWGRAKALGLAGGVLVALGLAGYHIVWVPALRSAAAERASSPVSRGPHPGKSWEVPGLGMKFVPVAGTRVLVSIWETRVQDFVAFVDATGHDATIKMSSYRGGQWALRGDTWSSPGFAQRPTHPVVGVNLADAAEFCRWLTERELAAARLAPHQVYRLATDAEWTAAVGPDEFPWGNQWPPPPGAGNYADEGMRRGPADRVPVSTIADYDDAYAGTAPVGSFAPNRLGLYDLGGNAWERVGGRRGGVRGASYRDGDRSRLRSLTIDSYELVRLDHVGFRVVCEVESEPQPTAQAGAMTPAGGVPPGRRP